MNELYKKIHDLLISYAAVTNLIGQNVAYPDPDEQHCIRPGIMDDGDEFPGIVLFIRTAERDDDLDGLCSHVKVTLELSCASTNLSEVWTLRDAACWGDGDPDNPAGLHTATDSSGLISCRHRRDDADKYELDDDTGDLLYVVESIYELEVNEGLLNE